MDLYALMSAAEKKAAAQFEHIDRVAFRNTEKVLDAFSEYRVSDSMFAGTTGYGYDDIGRDTLEKIYAKVFGAEAALVRLNIVNGSHAIACAMLSCLGCGDTLLSVTGAPYDTLQTLIGLRGKIGGTFPEYGI
ncbi:MAG: methionine gamma-lyase family protein, partial [Clostridia bacterium]|nr:methionine gamma-lyase family protein [Clostridia bacterium]